MVYNNVRTGFNHNLTKLQDKVLTLGSMVSFAIQRAMRALQERDDRLASEVIAEDDRINQLRFEIENDCMTLIAKQQPVAIDLRTIISVMNITLELERMGDHAAGIAKISLEINSQPPFKTFIYLPKMAMICRDMLNQSLNAFRTQDDEWSTRIAYMDDQVDDLYKEIFQELLKFMIQDPTTVTRAMYLLFIAHNLERIADRVTNICERSLFRSTGKMEEIPNDPGPLSLAS